MASSAIAAAPALYKTVPFDPVKDFDQVTTLMRVPWFLIVAADSPYKDIGSFLAQLRAGGKRLHFGAGNSSSRIAGELLKTAVRDSLVGVGVPPVRELLAKAQQHNLPIYV